MKVQICLGTAHIQVSKFCNIFIDTNIQPYYNRANSSCLCDWYPPFPTPYPPRRPAMKVQYKKITTVFCLLILIPAGISAQAIFSDDFEDGELFDDWSSIGNPTWFLQDGQACADSSSGALQSLQSFTGPVSGSIELRQNSLADHVGAIRRLLPKILSYGGSECTDSLCGCDRPWTYLCHISPISRCRHCWADRSVPAG